MILEEEVDDGDGRFFNQVLELRSKMMVFLDRCGLHPVLLGCRPGYRCHWRILRRKKKKSSKLKLHRKAKM